MVRLDQQVATARRLQRVAELPAPMAAMALPAAVSAHRQRLAAARLVAAHLEGQVAPEARADPATAERVRAQAAVMEAAAA